MIRIEKPTTFYLYIGKKGAGSLDGTFGGGGNGDVVGGGASDIRLLEGNTIEELKTRIIVAAGGGGGDTDTGGAGGTFNGFIGSNGYPNVATQTSAGEGFHNGKFGFGGGVPEKKR